MKPKAAKIHLGHTFQDDEGFQANLDKIMKRFSQVKFQRKRGGTNEDGDQLELIETYVAAIKNYSDPDPGVKPSLAVEVLRTIFHGDADFNRYVGNITSRVSQEKQKRKARAELKHKRKIMDH